MYRVRSVYKIIEPISLAKVKSRYGCKAAPRGLIYLPEGIPNDVPWKSQKCIIPRADDETTETARRTRGKRAVTAGGDSDEEEEELRPRKVGFVQLFFSRRSLTRFVQKARAADSPSLNANL